MVRQPVLYPAVYPWYVALAATDVVLTWFILTTFDTNSSIAGVPVEAREVNALANMLWSSFQETGLVVLKFSTVLFVLVACEIVGRHKLHMGRRLAQSAAALNAVPVIAALGQLSILAAVVAYHWMSTLPINPLLTARAIGF